MACVAPLDMRKGDKKLRGKRNLKREPIVNPWKHDPIEDDPLMQIVLELADEEAHAELAPQERGFLYCHPFWTAKKRILREKYQVVWKSPSDMNPSVDFD